MSEQNKNIAIWIPLRPGSSWRGEGIAQTVENIISNLSPSLACTLIVSREHSSDLRGLVEKRPNLKLVTLGFSKGKEVEITSNAIPRTSILQLALSKLKLNRIKQIKATIKNIGYALSLCTFTWLQRLGLFIPECKTIWIPTPIIPYAHLLKGRKIFSFWDPFVFEYRDFSDISATLYKQFKNIYINATDIITQSNANKDFLEAVFRPGNAQIHIVNNGSPDFSPYLPEFDSVGPRNYKEIIKKWNRPSYFAPDYETAYNKLVADDINKTVLWRLSQKIRSSDDKVIMISTQLRPYKGFGALFEVLDGLIRQENKYRYHIITTSEVPSWIKNKYPLLYERLHEIIRVSNKQLAQLYYMTDLVLHPSYVEGGLGVYPQFEAASVGTPCLVNIGRHVLEHGPHDLPPLYTSIDFVNTQATIEKIERLMDSHSEQQHNIMESHELAISWKDSAKKYDDIFSSGTQVC